MSVADRPDGLEGLNGISRRRALGFAIDSALQSLSIPGHDAIGHEREGTGGGDQFLGPPPALRRQRLGADLPL